LPELPEVETVRRVLEPQLRGRIIAGASVLRAEVAAHPDAAAFSRGVVSKAIKGLGRRGKFLLVHLNGGGVIIIHLRMTGRLLLTPAGYPEEPHTHVIFSLDGGNELRFADTRRFGRLWLIEAWEKDTYSGIAKLGLEPFDLKFGGAYLKQKLGTRRVSIKQGLLDQTAVAGIGNIYADEVLFAAKTDPRRPACELAKREWRTLSEKIRQVLENAIEGNAVAPEEYLAGGGLDYKHNDFAVYGRGGEKCRVCESEIKRIKIAGRSSFYCPGCQKI